VLHKLLKSADNSSFTSNGFKLQHETTTVILLTTNIYITMYVICMCMCVCAVCACVCVCGGGCDCTYVLRASVKGTNSNSLNHLELCLFTMMYILSGTVSKKP